MIKSKSSNNIFYSRNLSLSNPLILNNLSIQNLIITPNKLVNNYNATMLTNNYIFKSRYVNSPSSKKTPSNILYQMPKKNLFPNIISLTPYKSAKKLNCNNTKLFHHARMQSAQSFNNFINKQEKCPKDSIKTKNNTNFNNTQILINQNKNIKNTLKNSVSQKLFQTINNPFAITNNLSISQNFIPQKKINENNSIHICITNTNNKATSIQKRLKLEPKGMINLSEFQSSEQIGKGSYGKIYCVRWLKNNKLYALKKEILTDIETIEKRKEAWKIIQNFIKNTKCTGLINIYANLLLKNNIGTEYHYYELMERAERDWDQEINVRSQYNLYYKEYELLNILNQLISTLVLMQNNHITHRDIKPQNILVINGKYKLCDFGEIRVLKRNGLVVQRIRGSELYMSPILFKGLHSKLAQVKHNTYKSDVFSLGMCFFYASSLTYNGVDSIREVLDMNKIKEILFKFLGNKYSEKFILLILLMLEVNEEKRPDFIELEKKIRETFKF